MAVTEVKVSMWDCGFGHLHKTENWARLCAKGREKSDVDAGKLTPDLCAQVAQAVREQVPTASGRGTKPVRQHEVARRFGLTTLELEYALITASKQSAEPDPWFGLPVRVVNSLKFEAYNMQPPGRGLVDMAGRLTMDKLREVPNLGPVGVRQVVAAMRAAGLEPPP